MLPVFPKRALELFAGTHSIGKALEGLGWEVVSVDLCPKHKPTILANVLHWDYTVYPKGHFDFIWARLHVLCTPGPGLRADLGTSKGPIS